MTFETGKYEIELSDVQEANYHLNQYDDLYIDQSQYKPTSLINTRLVRKKILLKSILIGATGGGTGIHKTSFIADDGRIVACCGDTVFCISIPALCLLWKTKADGATCFEIFKYREDYIVHGELEITRLCREGHILWQRSGADIFTTLEGKAEFTITENYILASDWGYRKYKFDFNGNLL